MPGLKVAARAGPGAKIAAAPPPQRVWKPGGAPWSGRFKSSRRTDNQRLLGDCRDGTVRGGRPSFPIPRMFVCLNGVYKLPGGTNAVRTPSFGERVVTALPCHCAGPAFLERLLLAETPLSSARQGSGTPVRGGRKNTPGGDFVRQPVASSC